MTPLRAARLVLSLAALSVVLAGCGSSSSSKPTTTVAKAGQSNFILLTVRNDTPSAVWFDQCQGTCNKLHEHRWIPAGHINLILGINDGTQFADLVTNAAGKRLGCIYMKFDHVEARPVVLISSMTACK